MQHRAVIRNQVISDLVPNLLQQVLFLLSYPINQLTIPHIYPVNYWWVSDLLFGNNDVTQSVQL